MCHILKRQQPLKVDNINEYYIEKKKYRSFDIPVTYTLSSVIWMARCGFMLLVYTLALTLLVNPSWATAEGLHPLEPLDTSSPRATLTNFLNTFEEGVRFWHDEYKNSGAVQTTIDFVRSCSRPAVRLT